MNDAFLIEWSLKALVVLALAFGLARAMRRQAAALRHLLWLCAMVAVIFLPTLIRYAPDWRILPRFEPRPQSATVQLSDISPPRPLVKKPSTSDQSASHVRANSAELSSANPQPWFSYVWLIGAIALLARIGLSLHSLRALRTFGTCPFEGDPGLKADGITVLQALGAQPKGAMTWGVHRPVVLLPFDSDKWSDARLEAVLAHEFAHVRRWDFLTQLIAEFACALLWFLPPIWIAAREMRAEAELAADDAVLKSGFRPSSYAEVLLLSAAEIGGLRRPTLRGASAMNSPKIESRIASVLSPSTRRGMSSVQAVAVLAAIVVAAPAVSALRQSAVDPKVAAAKAELALKRAKQLTLGAMFYQADYDDVFPYVQQTASAISVLQPYLKMNGTAQEIMKTPRGEFHYNLNVGGVVATQFPEPANTPLWTEVVTDSSVQPYVGYCDGHVKLMYAQGKENYDRYVKMKFPRKASMHPLPKDYVIKWNHMKGWSQP